MSRTFLNFWLDVTLMISLMLGLWGAAVLRFIFPPATVADQWVLWGWTYDRWFDFEFTMLGIFALSTVVHVMLHWSWICGVVTSRMLRSKDGQKRQVDDGTRTLIGVGLLAAVLAVMGGGIFIGMLTVVRPA